MKKSHFLILMFYFGLQAKAQPDDWTFKEPVITINFGTGNIRDVNMVMPYQYERVRSSCPSDGHYTYTSYTSDCFRADWFTLAEDHTAGDADGNIMLVNSSYEEGPFFSTGLNGLKGSTAYEFSVWMLNVCKISDKCPSPLLPNITIRLQTLAGKPIGEFSTGELARRYTPAWIQYRSLFTTPSRDTSLNLVMINNAPGGCGNDFALDDITIREIIIPSPVASVTHKEKALVKKQPVTVKQAPKKAMPSPATTKTQTEIKERTLTSPGINSIVIKQAAPIFPPPPPSLVSRTNSLIKQLETEAGEIRLDLYDNGEIDGDTVSIYHNNELIVSHARLSQKPITFRVEVNAANPYHELVMVAENLGSIPPNTSLMIITTVSKRYKVFISSTEQNNAKVVLNLKE
ncbi:MAG: hypothetical protein ABI675_17350 [Chitinophagaceae bacterium]